MSGSMRSWARYCTRAARIQNYKLGNVTVTPVGPALITSVFPDTSCCPPLAWIWPHTTSRGDVRIIVSRTATLPRCIPDEDLSTAPSGGEWVTSTQPSGQVLEHRSRLISRSGRHGAPIFVVRPTTGSRHYHPATHPWIHILCQWLGQAVVKPGHRWSIHDQALHAAVLPPARPSN